jgi:hypothetical protein
MTATPTITGVACAAHRSHRPATPHVLDQHHVIPRSWQHFELGAERLFDPRTVPLCPNDHRGVHERIVALMKGEKPGRDRLWPIARLALDRFTAAGGSLDALRNAGLFGEQ